MTSLSSSTRDPRPHLFQRKPNFDQEELDLLDRVLPDCIADDLIAYQHKGKNYYRFYDESDWQEEEFIIQLDRTKDCFDALDVFRTITNFVWGLGDPVTIHVSPRDFGLARLYGRFDYTWHKISIKQYMCIGFKIIAWPQELKTPIQSPAVPQDRVGVELRRLYISNYLPETGRKHLWLRFYHDDVFETAFALYSVKEGCVLPTYPIMWILDFLPEIGELNEAQKMNWLETLQTSVRRVMAKREEN